MTKDLLDAEDFNAIANLEKGLDDLEPQARIQLLVEDAQGILAKAYVNGIDEIGKNAVMYDEWAPKILDAIEVQAQAGLQYGSPDGETYSDRDQKEYRFFCQEVIDKMPAIRRSVENSEFKLPTFDLDNGSM